ncbi:hypothetical protein FJY71_06345 [candidate division WOR-3 bacterium]|nr:hypothetical protein [candidate division WOR-3 bacterium]
MRTCTLLLLMLGAAAAQNLIVNGDFEQALDVGWTQMPGGSGYHNYNRGTSYHPDPDNEVWVQQYDGGGWTALDQSVFLWDVNYDLSFWAKMNYGGGSSTCWPVTAVCVMYLSTEGIYLGETRFYWHSPYCNWTPSGSLHLIEVTNNDWTEYSMNLYEEITRNLPDVNPSQVHRVTISLHASTSGG